MSKIIAHIRNNATGEIRQYPDEEILEPGETVPDTYLWEEGNYSCDCSREEFFEKAVGNPEPENTRCSDDRFSVKLEIQETGEICYNELED